MPIIVFSSLDPAGRNISSKLVDNFGFIEKANEKFRVWKKNEIMLVEVNTPLTETNYLDIYFKTDFYVFASKHRSESNKPCLTVHGCGEWDKELSFIPSFPMKNVFLVLCEITCAFPLYLECTHHGPIGMQTPLFFVEIGSSEKEWTNHKLGEIIAEGILKGIEKVKKWEVGVGFGGTHYCPSFTKVEKETSVSLGHIFPNYAIDKIDDALITQGVKRVKEKVNFLVFDWKGLKNHQRKRLIEFAEKNGLEWVKTKKLLS